MTSLLLVLMMQGATTQFLVSTRAGLVNYVQGSANVKAAISVPAGEVIATGPGAAVELLLNPGSYLRMGENTRVVHLIARGGEARVIPHHSGHPGRFQCERRVVSKVSGEYRRRRPAGGRMASRIFRKCGRDQQRRPRGIKVCRRIAVGVGQSNGGGGPPEDVSVLGFPAADARVRHGDVHQGEEPSIF